MIMVSTSEHVSQPQVNVVLIRVALVMVSGHSSKTLRQTPKPENGSPAYLSSASLKAALLTNHR